MKVIPQPLPIPFIGNVHNIDFQRRVVSLNKLAEFYGPIFKLTFFGKDVYIVSSVALLDELCNEQRFQKKVSQTLEILRYVSHDGLFTAYPNEPGWGVAHRVVLPHLGPMGIQNMFDEMYDVSSQLVTKWARLGPGSKINASDDFTRLTLDALALCAMDTRFNSFYHEKMHPFMDAMCELMVEANIGPRRTWVERWWNKEPRARFEQNTATLRSIAKEMINHRRANQTDKKDLLNAMLYSKDPKTGVKMSEESIIDNLITFLVAGHETTSGLLSFTFYYLLKYPESYKKAQEEVDAVVGKGPVRFEHMAKLPYLEAVLRESLRLQPTAPVFGVTPVRATGPVVLGGEYLVPGNAEMICLLTQVGQDKEAFGHDADQFIPERMMGENFNRLPKNAWKPFGNGTRGCIGRSFAWQEALIVTALIVQNFNMQFDDPKYKLDVKQTLTIKPDNFYMRAVLRDGVDSVQVQQRMFADAQPTPKIKPKPITNGVPKGKPMTVLYGSNSGTCEGLAQTIAADATNHRYSAVVKPLDVVATEGFPQNQAVVIITASYEGDSPDNAKKFMQWLKKADSESLKNTRFALFGCGHRDWVATYQKVPKAIEKELLKHDSTQFVPRGESDVAAGAIFDDFDDWTDIVWSALDRRGSTFEVDGLDMTVSTSARAVHLRQRLQNAVVMKNEILTKGQPEKRFIELALPSGMAYEPGDYVAILPMNNIPTISRVLRRFRLPWDSMMILKKGAHTTIPVEKELSIATVLSAYVELGGTPTKKNIMLLSKYSSDELDLSHISHMPLLDILERYPQIDLPFHVYLGMLPPMRIRQYSIASSPSNDPTSASIVFTVFASDGKLGVATNYLRHLEPGNTVLLSVKKSHHSFHLPPNLSTPVIMICAGTGLAPFCGFMQERAVKKASGKEIGEALIIIGCRSPSEDKLFAEQITQWENAGVVKVCYAFSRAQDVSEGCKYAQERLWHERQTVSRLFDEGARVYICGNSSLGRGVADTAVKIAMENRQAINKSITFEEGMKWWEGLRGERYAVDVFD